jgi:serine/threonine-protein kinase
VLAGEPLHLRDDNILRSTIDGLDASASARAPERDTPPELDAVCVAATATDRDERTATAREVADALDRYLDGDRDLERRAQLADEHARSGIRAMGDAFAGGDAAEQARRQAVRELGRALALDPDHDTALAAMSRLILEPPAQVPEEVEAALEAHKTKRLQLEAGGATVALLLSLAFIPVMMWIGIKNPALVATFLAIPVVLAAISFTLARWRPGPWLRYAQASLYAVFAIAASRMFSPLIVVPVLCTMVVMIVSLNGFSRLLVVTAAVMTAATVAPLLAEAAGLLTPTLWFAADALTIQSAGLHQPAVPSLIGLTTFHVLSIWGPAIVVGRIARRSWNHERQIQLHAWHLRQLVPDTTTC